MSKLNIKNNYKTTETCSMLNILLATQIDFYYTYKHFHWNLKNSDFYQYHTLFDDHATIIHETQDKLAERIRQMGEITSGEVNDVVKITLLKDKLANENNLDAIKKYLIECHDLVIGYMEQVIKHTSNDVIIKDNISDYATADIITGMLESHQQMRWFLTASSD